MSTNTAAANAVANNAANAVKLVQAFEDAGVTLTDASSGSEITAQMGGRRRRNTRRNRKNNMSRKNRRNNMSRKNRKNRKNSRRNRKNSRRNRK
jgi:hypothetical protein